jgi:hypothetical protein
MGVLDSIKQIAFQPWLFPSLLFRRALCEWCFSKFFRSKNRAFLTGYVSNAAHHFVYQRQACVGERGGCRGSYRESETGNKKVAACKYIHMGFMKKTKLSVKMAAFSNRLGKGSLTNSNVHLGYFNFFLAYFRPRQL